MWQSELRNFFEPRGVAVFGSVRNLSGTAYGVVKNMLDFGFSGKIYPVNPSASSGEVLGLHVYSDVSEISGDIDLAVIIIPPRTVPDVVSQCAQRGIRAAIVVSEGFAEVGEEGKDLQARLVEISRRTGIRILGPNTLGVLNTSNYLVTTPYLIGYNKPLKGTISYCSQSGLLTFGTHPLRDRAYPVSKVCDFGNKCDVNEVDLLEYLVNDSGTAAIVMHLEDIKDGQKFLGSARKAVGRKPVLIFKPTKSEVSAKAAASHTGALAGNDQVYDTAFRQAGVIRVNSWQEFWEIPRVFATQPLPRGNRVAIITATGGAGVILVEEAIRVGLVITEFTTETKRKLAVLSPRLAQNPVDVGPLMAVSIGSDPIAVYERSIPIVLEDRNVDCAVVVCPGNLAIVDVFRRIADCISQLLKPVTVFCYGVNLADIQETVRQLQNLGFPAYLELEMAVKALGVAAIYSRIKGRAPIADTYSSQD